MIHALAGIALALVVSSPGESGREPPEPDVRGMEPAVVEAIAAARQEVLAEPSSSRTWGHFGAVLHAHNLWDSAIPCYERANALAPTEFRWVYLLAVALDASGESDRACSVFEQAATLRPGYVPIHLRLALARSRRGELTAAIAAAEKAVALDPQGAFGLRTLGELMLAADDAERALGLLSRASQVEPEDGGTMSALARAYSRLGQPAQAERAARQAQRLPFRIEIDDPIVAERVTATGVSARHRLAIAQRALDEKEYKGALATLQPMVQLRADDPDVRLLLALAHAGLWNLDEAERELERALELKPDHVRALIELGRLLELTDRPGEAVVRYRLAREASPRDPSVLARLAEATAAAGQKEQLVTLYRELAELAPSDPLVWLNLGTAQVTQGDFSGARESFETAAELAPSLVEAQWRLGLVLERLGLGEEAAARFRAVLRLDPQHGEARSRVGLAPP